MRSLRALRATMMMQELAASRTSEDYEEGGSGRVTQDSTKRDIGITDHLAKERVLPIGPIIHTM